MPLPSAYKADALLVLVTLIAAVSWMLSKEAVILMPPLLFMCLRFLLASLILAMAARGQLRKLDRAQLLRSLRVGIVFAGAMCCWVTGLAFGSHVGEGAFLTSLGVVLVPVVARLFFAEAVPRSTWLALPVAACGLALLSLDGGFQSEPGQLFFVAAAIIFALYFNLNMRAANTLQRIDRNGHRHEQQKVPALVLTTVVLATVGLITGMLSLILETWPTDRGQITGMMVLWVVLSATLGTALRFFLQTYAQSLSVQSHGVVIMVLEPMWTALFAGFWFAETMTLVQGLGCGLIFLSLLLNRWRAVRRLLQPILTRVGAGSD